MPSVEKQRERLISLLKELFQLDQPDLDFGFYRIMHAKAGQVTKFLEEDLLGIIRDAFGEADGARVEQAKAAYEAARKQAEEFGAPDPDAAPKVKEAKAAWDAAKDSGSNEGDVYDHLYRFFERYYDNGDFMSRRYFARETDGKAAPYAVPYDGREVYLHWANRDQYYIKTSEYLTNFTFDPTQAKEFKDKHGALFEQKPLKVHCRIVSASEGEHNNVKPSEQTERYFIIHEPEPVKIEVGDTGEPELVIQFQYRPDPERTGQESTWRKKRLAEAADKVKALLPKLDGAGDYVTALMTPAPTEVEKDRTLLEKYLAQYTGRNTMDYFIHKDLGGFLRRELDFYIKNEVMRLDDIESADAPRVEAYLAKVKVLRRIAQHLIDFLAQLEDFQKRLWLKKKFVVDTQYFVTLDRIPEEFYPEIVKNSPQREEWIRLFAIDTLEGYSVPLSVDFLRANSGLAIDTARFEKEFSDRIVSSLEAINANLAGVLVHSDNFAGLRLLSKGYDSAVQGLYIDPPYNTDASPIVYKNGYKASSWATLFSDRFSQARKLLRENASVCVAIDDEEYPRLSMILEHDHGLVHQGTVVVRSKPQGRPTTSGFSANHDYATFWGCSEKSKVGRLPRSGSRADRYPHSDNKGVYAWSNFRKSGTDSDRADRKKSFYPVFVKGDTVSVPDATWDEVAEKWSLVGVPDEGTIVVWPIDQEGNEKVWTCSRARLLNELEDIRVSINDGERVEIQKKYRPNDEGALPGTWWDHASYSASESGTKILKERFGNKPFDFPKSISLVVDNLRVLAVGSDAVAMDYFAGSGTTGAAVMALNREDGGRRSFVLMEQERYFDETLVPRIKMDAYSTTWRNGVPRDRDSISICCKYIRLETYEDALNNLAFRPAPSTAQASTDFARNYVLRYWLDFETKGSPSLLNIEWFDDPTAYKLKIKKPGTDEYVEKAVDLVETFNWLIGLHVEHLDRWRGYDATFKREVDPELPEDTNTRLLLDGALKETDDGAWRFRKVEGYTLRAPGDHSDRERALVVWRKLTGDPERDNLMLDEWFRKYRLSAQDTEFDVIYVNGSNNLPNLRKDEETWKVRLIEEAFHQAMWDVEG